MPFRARVDLTRLFSDERARCMVLVPAASERTRLPVSWLTRRLRALLGPALRGPLALLVSGHLLPDTEPLSLLRPQDEICVIPLEKEWSSTDECPSDKKSDVEEFNTNLTHETKKTRQKRLKFEQPDTERDGLNDEIVDEANDGEEALRAGKMRALQLLHAIDETVPSVAPPAVEPPARAAPATAPAPPAARPRRRRVRRRRAVTADKERHTNNDLDEKSAVCSETWTGDVPALTSRSLAMGATGPVSPVSVTARRGRLVRPLDEPRSPPHCEPCPHPSSPPRMRSPACVNVVS